MRSMAELHSSIKYDYNRPKKGQAQERERFALLDDDAANSNNILASPSR